MLASWDKDFADKFISFVPSFVISKLFEPISFKKYSRAFRKNIQILFFDEVESQKEAAFFKENVVSIFKESSEVTKRKLKILKNLESGFVSLLNNKQVERLFLTNIRSLTSRSFISNHFRAGIIFIGGKQFLFLSRNGRCYILKGKRTIQEFLKIFMNSELVDGIIAMTNEALERIQDANTFIDTIQYNRPYQLYLES